MLNKSINLTSIPYSHHYRCVAQMVGSIANQAVMEYILDEFQYRLKTNQPTSFVLSYHRISSSRNITRRTAKSTIEGLKNTRIFTIHNTTITLDVSRFLSLVTSFFALKDSEEDQKLFTQALLAGDDGTLEKLGYSLYQYENNDLKNLNGNVWQGVSFSTPLKPNQTDGGCYLAPPVPNDSPSVLNDSGEGCHLAPPELNDTGRGCLLAPPNGNNTEKGC